MKQAAADAAPGIAALLTSIEAARQHSDPNSLLNRPARVAVPDVNGAPGDGNQSLTRQMRDKLSKLGPVVQDTANGADFIAARPGPHGARARATSSGSRSSGSSRTRAGDERGRVVQLNEVPAGSLNHYWGDVAVVVAQEASRRRARRAAHPDRPALTAAPAERARSWTRHQAVARRRAAGARTACGRAPGDQHRMKIVACNSNRPLAEAVAANARTCR